MVSTKKAKQHKVVLERVLEADGETVNEKDFIRILGGGEEFEKFCEGKYYFMKSQFQQISSQLTNYGDLNFNKPSLFNVIGRDYSQESFKWWSNNIKSLRQRFGIPSYEQ